MRGREGEFETMCGLLRNPGSGLSGDVRRMIVEDQLDRRVGRIGGVGVLEEFDEFAAAMTVPDQGMNLAAEKVDAGQTVCPSLKRPTHPRCYGEGYPDWPGRASNKEGESWASIAGLSSESIRQSCAMPLRLLRRGVVGTFAISARSTPRKRRHASSSPNLQPNIVN